MTVQSLEVMSQQSLDVGNLLKYDRPQYPDTKFPLDGDQASQPE